MQFLIRYAALAPSASNSQPWLFRIREDALELFADRSRSITARDPHDRELTISCGAALGFAHLAARNFGRETHIDLLPSPRNPDLLARLRFGVTTPPSFAEARRFQAIFDDPASRPNATTGAEREKPIADLCDLAFEPGIELSLTANRESHVRIKNLVAQTSRRHRFDYGCPRELARWTSGHESSPFQGMRAENPGIRDRLTHGMASLFGWLDNGFATVAGYPYPVEQPQWLGLFVSEQDDERSWLRTGMALADVLLEAAAGDIDCSFLNQPIGVPALRPRVAAIFETQGSPQLLIRLRQTGSLASAHPAGD